MSIRKISVALLIALAFASAPVRAEFRHIEISIYGMD